MVANFRWFKGHGTENDFVLLPDHDGAVHGDLDPALARRLCHRRRGIGADGVLRVVRAEVYADPEARAAASAGAEWFMDYRNADGSRAQMCGNGIRVFARYLEHEGLVDSGTPALIGTRDGVKGVRWCSDGRFAVNMGTARAVGEAKVGVAERCWSAHHVDVGNPHAVVILDSLEDAGPLVQPPRYDADVFPDGVNVEFAVRTHDRAAAMRVYERGVGETRSCGTGACAVAVAVAGDSPRPRRVQVTTLGGPLSVLLDEGDRVELTGPAVLVAQGTYPVQ